MGWLESGIDSGEAEDVAQHTFETASISMLLLDFTKQDLDAEKVLKMAIIHDWAESITGDFSKEVSDQLGDGAKEEIEEKVFENVLLEDVGVSENYLDIWREYSACETDEAKLVYVADRLSILLEAGSLFKKGKSSEKLKEIWETVRKELDGFCGRFPILEALLEDLDRVYSEDA